MNHNDGSAVPFVGLPDTAGANMPLWIVGEACEPEPLAWRFVGVFDDEDLAVAACMGPNHFIGPAVLNERLAEEPEAWPGAYYPLADGNANADIEIER